jgi:hypothetical protein
MPTGPEENGAASSPCWESIGYRGALWETEVRAALERRLIPIYRSIPSYNGFVAWHLVRSQCLAYRVQDRSPQLLA